MSIVFIAKNMGGCIAQHPKQQQMRRAKQNQDILKKKLQTLRQSNVKKESENKRKQEQIQAIKLQDKNCISEISRVQAQIKVWNSHNARLRQDLQAINKDKREHQSEVQQLKVKRNALQKQVQRKKNNQKDKQKAQKQLQQQLNTLLGQITTTQNQISEKQKLLNKLSTKKTFDNVAAKSQLIQKDDQISELQKEVWKLELQLQKILGDDQPIDSDIQELRNRITSQVTAASYMLED